MLATLLKLLGIDPVGKIIDGLNSAYQAKLTAQNDRERIDAEVQIKRLDQALALHQEAAAVVKEGMQHRAFWIAWLIAAMPCAAWFGWGMLDSLLNGALPDVAALPPQLKEYADIVFGNIFYAGGATAGLSVLAKAVASRKAS